MTKPDGRKGKKMRDLENKVYDYLRGKTVDILPWMEKVSKIDRDVASGRYSDEARREMLTEKTGILREIEDFSAETIKSAHDMVDVYRAKVQQENELRGEDVTEDAKLLGLGVTLTEADITGMLRRNAGNRTMEQLILRYADEHGIKPNGAVYVNSAAQSIAALNSLDGVINYYAGWIGKSNNLDMLDKFFGRADRKHA